MKILTLTLGILILTLCVLVTIVQGQTYTEMTSLKTDMLTSYDATVIPVTNQSHSMNVNVTLFLLSILEVDQVKGAITYGVHLKLEWYDEQITWTPASYGGLTKMYLSSNDVWTPQIVIGNPVSFTSVESSWMQVEFTSDGHAIMNPLTTLEATCAFYMKYWPFDMQQCDLALFPFAYTDQSVSLQMSSHGVDASHYSKNSEWNLLSDMITTDVDTTYGNSILHIYFKIARQPSFYLLTVIMPINGIGMLTCLVFLLPSESGERVSYAITIMLALAVFLTVTAAELPKTSEPIPILCIYVLFGMMICFGAVVIVILNLILYYREDSVPISNWYKKIVRISRICGQCKRKKSSGDNIQVVSPVERRNSQVSPMDEKGKPKPNNSYDDDVDDEEEITWQIVSKAIDKILFYILVIMTYLPSIVILIVLAAASDFGP